MNLQKLQYMAANTGTITDSDLAELRQLISAYPFYALPHAVLAKVYYEKEHYLFENALTQAAMRVDNREWLYGYIHGSENAGDESTETLVAAPVETAIEAEAPLEPVAIEEPEAMTSGPEVYETIAERDEAVEDVLMNDINAFLGDLNATEQESVAEEIIEAPEVITPEVEVPPAQVQPVVDEEIVEEEQVVENGSIIRPDTEEAITELEAVVETEDMVEAETEEEIESVSIPDIHLRKHPVYNVEEFLEGPIEGKTDEKPAEDGSKDFFYWLSHPKAKDTATPEADIEQEEVTPPVDEDEISHTPDTKTANDRLSIIDQFIKANPSISRPKREFYNAENMARRSESPDFEYVSETLANIYYEQGNTDMAIKAYEKLSLQNPLKQAYFASLIEKIKKEKR